MHKALEIRNAVYTNVSALVSAGHVAEVLKNNISDPDNYPSVSVVIGTDVPEVKTNAFTDWQLTLFTDIKIQASDSDVDADMLNIREEIHKALMADYTQGLNFVLDVEPGDQYEPELNSEGDSYTCYTRVAWMVKYRVNTNNPGL